jgi:5-formyltetrahydrofolate cyclo-ligase
MNNMPADNEAKQSLRSVMRGRRKALPSAIRGDLSLAAQEYILKEPAWKKAHCVALYMAMPDETDTAALLEDAWQKKTVLLPLCSREKAGHMDFLACSGYHELRPGPFGILEPNLEQIRGKAVTTSAVSGACQDIPLPQIIPDLIIVPGVAFDRSGHRLGMGGGYYDRIFARTDFSDVPRLGLAFDFQVMDSLPAKDWDKKVHALSTEKGLLWIQHP